MKKQTVIKLVVVLAAVLLAVSVGLLGWKMLQEQKYKAAGTVSVDAEGKLTLTFSSADSYDPNSYNPSSAYDDNGFWSGIKASDYVTLPEDFSALHLDKKDLEPTESDIAQALESLLENYNTKDIVADITDRPCALGDTVIFDYSGSVDGVVFRGGTAENADLTLGSGKFISGFEEGIVGHTPGEEFDIEVTFPKGYNDSTDADGNKIVLSEAKAVFHIKLHSIRTVVLTDTWVHNKLSEEYGVHTVAELNSYLHDSLADQNLMDAVYQALLVSSKFSGLPRVMVDSEATYLLYIYSYYASSYQTDLSTYLTAMGYKDTTDLLNKNAEGIISYCQQYLLFQAVAEQYGITVTEEQMKGYESYIQTYGKGYTANSLLSTNALKYVSERITVD